MIDRIDLFMPPENKSLYKVLPHFTEKFFEALIRAQVSCRLLTAEKKNPKPFLEALFNDSPDCTLSFNGLLPDNKGNFFCDMIKIPHIACLIDSPIPYLSLMQSEYTIITVPDRYSYDFLLSLQNPQVLFMPHGVERELFSNEDFKKEYDVVMLSSCIDYETLEKEWDKNYPKQIVEIMRESALLALQSNELSVVQAFIEIMDKKAPFLKENTQLPDMIDQVEMYVKGKDRVELMRAMEGLNVHLFGSGIELWKKYLVNCSSTFHFHEAVDYTQALEIMRKAKVVLNSCAWLKNGIHERVLSAMALKALVVTNRNIYMREHFEEGKEIVFYDMGQWSKVKETIKDFLANEEKRKQVALEGFYNAKKNHTWDVRVTQLLKELPPLLERI